MRNGWSGVGIVADSTKVPEDQVSALVGLDATLDVNAPGEMRRVCPIMVRMGSHASFCYDTMEFITAEDDSCGEQLVKESKAGRIVFVGTPGPKTTAALELVQTGGRWANVVPTPQSGSPVRILWRGLTGHIIEAGPEWEPALLEPVLVDRDEKVVPVVEEVDLSDSTLLLNALAERLEE